MHDPQPSQSGFPTIRMRRLRHNPQLRDMIRAAAVEPRRLVQPLFVRTGRGVRQPIDAMPGVFQFSIDELVREAQTVRDAGVRGAILFGIPAEKDPLGKDAYSDAGIVQQAVRAVKSAVPDLLLMTDVCFCEYTDHGHCGVVTGAGDKRDVDNDATLDLLARQAVSHARAGADLVAPSGMIDGMVGAIRRALDAEGFTNLPVMSYAAKYASAFYGPFRDAAESAPAFGDRRSYQMDPAVDAGQALREVELDLAEGADIVMVKPALAYLDVLRRVRERFPGVPVAAYNVSGEYSMVKAAAARGWLDERAAVFEMLTAMHRAGADLILTYWAKEIAGWLAAQ